MGYQSVAKEVRGGKFAGYISRAYPLVNVWWMALPSGILSSLVSRPNYRTGPQICGAIKVAATHTGEKVRIHKAGIYLLSS